MSKIIRIEDKSKCSGCEACINICPKKCITMKEDEEGFRYPVVDKEKCINCGACDRICPFINEIKRQEKVKDMKFYAAYNKNDKILNSSSSGGIFWQLAKQILKNDGVIYGVVQESTYDIKYVRAETEEQCEPIRGSKYLQANVNGIYLKVKEDLQKDRYVLFSGTPCQVAGLYSVLGKDYEKLYTIDVICHGVPSMKIYREYIKYTENKFKKKVINIKWRDKVNGKWGPNRVTVFFEDGTKMTRTSKNNLFQKGFLDDIYLRPSCYKCLYPRLPRVGDISLADFWGYDGKMTKENKNRGLSAVILSSEKGKNLFERIMGDLNYHPVSEKYLTTRSKRSCSPSAYNNKREEFFSDFKKMSYIQLCKKYKIKVSVMDKLKFQLFRVPKKVMRECKKLVK